MTRISFLSPELLWPTLAVTVVVLAIGIAWLRRRKGIVDFYGTDKGRIYGQNRASCFVALFTLICLGLGLLLCGPYRESRISHDIYESLHIVFAVDASRSMLVPVSEDSGDFRERTAAESPCRVTRLAAASREVESFVEELRQNRVGRVALVIFSRFAYPAVPLLTDDLLLVERRLEKEMLPENALTMAEGTNHWNAVNTALGIFDPSMKKKKLLIILTDGEPSAPPGELSAAREEALLSLKRSGPVHIVVVGVGLPGVELAVPAAWHRDGCPDEEEGFLVQRSGPDAGEIMTTVTDASLLEDLSVALGGSYIHSATGRNLAEKLKGVIDREKVKTGVKPATASVDLSSFLTAALLVLLGVLSICKTP